MCVYIYAHTNTYTIVLFFLFHGGPYKPSETCRDSTASIRPSKATLQIASVEFPFSPHREFPVRVEMAEAPLCPSTLACPHFLSPALASRLPRAQRGTTTWRSTGGQTSSPFLGAFKSLSEADSVVLANGRQHKNKKNLKKRSCF